MIAYVESNFVLELVLEQEQQASAQAILRLAEERKIDISFPTFSLIEPSWTIRNRGRQREELCSKLGLELNQLRRSPAHDALVVNLENAWRTMLELERHEGASLESATQRMLNAGKAIEIDKSVFENSLIYRNRYGLSLFDAVVYSAVVADLQRSGDVGPKCFVS